jgi:tRNA pseudouridine13 synthase
LSLRTLHKIYAKKHSRFTDFLVFEVDQDGRVIHLKSLGKPETPKKEKEEDIPAPTTPIAVENVAKSVEGETEEAATPNMNEVAAEETNSPKIQDVTPAIPGLKVSTKEEPWPEHFDATLLAFLDQDKVSELKKIFLEGPEPPRVSDSGWGGRVPSTSTAEELTAVEELDITEKQEDKLKRDNARGRGGKRGGRGGRGGGRGGGREDTRKVVSEVSFFH